MINKNIVNIALVLAIFAVSMAIPGLVIAQEVPTDGGNVNGASAAPSIDGETINGAVNAPSIGGAETNGAIANTSTGTPPPSIGGENTNGATTSVAPSTGGNNVNGAVQNVTTGTVPPSTGGAGTNGASSGVLFSITTSTSGSGSVTCKIYGTNTACPAFVPAGTQVEFTITPASGWKIKNYVKDGAKGIGCDENTTPCTLITLANANISLSADFVEVGGSSGGGSSGSYSSGGSALLQVNLATSSCPLLSDYLRLGGSNNSLEVTKLQTFLKNSEGLNVSVSGIFDEATEAAVRAFQQKYLNDVMGPWGATQSSGIVYITTLEKINELACNSPFVLSEGDQAIIDAYKARLASGEIGVETTTGPVLEIGAGISTTTIPSGTSSDEIGLNGDESQTGAVGNVSILSRFWNFILDLFR